MGTNFYLATTSKEIRDKYFGYDYELTDNPEWAYRIHIAKTSMGWLPLFQAHECFKSIKQLKDLYYSDEFFITDEYGDAYTWEKFDERVLKFNGGVKGAIPRKEIKQDPNSKFYDPHAPSHMPISHFEYDDCKYSSDYFMDDEGYEFTTHWFS